MQMEESQLWHKLSRELFQHVDMEFLSTFREPGNPNNRLAAWDPLDRSLRFFKFLLFNQCAEKPDSFFEMYEQLGNTRLGNPVTVRVVRNGVDVEVNLDHLFSVEEADFLARNLDTARIEHVVEIGAGFGRTAQAILKLFKKVRSYTIIDLPNILSLSAQYLRAVLDPPEFDKLRFVDAFEFAKSKAEHGRAVDLVINVDSFQEMTPATIDFYMTSVIGASRFFFSKNAIGKYQPEVVGLARTPGLELSDVFDLGRSREVIDIFCNRDVDVARRRHAVEYLPSPEFAVAAQEPLGIFPYYQNVLYERASKTPSRG